MKRPTDSPHTPRREKSGPTRHKPSRRPPRSSGRDTGRHRHAREPEPIRVPAGWETSKKRSRKKLLRTVAKVAMVVIGFGLLTLPFLINHFDRGSFYYQEVPIEVPEVLPIETPPTVDLPVATPVESGVPPAEGGLAPVEPAPVETESEAPDALSDDEVAAPDDTPLPEPGAAE